MKKQKRPKAPQKDKEDFQNIVGQLLESEDGVNPELESQLENLNKSELLQVVMATTVSHSGPLPQPADFAGYEEICPGAAERILKMAELEQIHRQREETKAGDNYFSDRKIGYFLGALLLAFLIGAGLYCVVIGEGWFSAGFLGVALLSVISKFIPNT